VALDLLDGLYSLCFFFQAEDGIRDRNVTGVQTCALPISDPIVDLHHKDIMSTVLPELYYQFPILHMMFYILIACLFAGMYASIRSEERRVGKECRSRWWTHHYNNEHIQYIDAWVVVLCTI